MFYDRHNCVCLQILFKCSILSIEDIKYKFSHLQHLDMEKYNEKTK